MRRKIWLILVAMLVIALPYRSTPAQTSLTEDDVINQVMSLDLSSTTSADDLVAELRQLAQSYVNDPNDYGGIGYSFTDSVPVILYLRGTTVSTLAMILPLLPGTVRDASTVKGKLAIRLKADVLNYLLNQQYWDWEYNTDSVPGANYVQPSNPRIILGWNHRWKSGPHWEKIYALWAYAYYTGDWATIQSHWDFIKSRYQEGYKLPDSSQRSIMVAGGSGVYRNDTNDLANGLIGYVRMADHFNDPTAAQARKEAHDALNAIPGWISRCAWDSCPVTVGWDATPQTIRGEWSPGYNLTPELGRWIHAAALATAQMQLNNAVQAGALQGMWWSGFVNNINKGYGFGEDRWGLANLSHELFLGRAWMLNEDAVTLREMKPWHVIMGYPPQYEDMLYFRSLYALISRYASITWVTVN
jgi:hypothetical protein